MITEGIKFGDFDSIKMGLYLIEREMPSPEPKIVKESIPYSQGAEDFSMITGERNFEERIGTYRFMAFDVPYNERKRLEQDIKRQTVIFGKSELYDTHDLGYYWLGTCDNVEVIDDEEFDRLEVIMEFVLYPFMLSASQSYSDLYQDVQPEAYVPTDYIVDGELTIEILNYGDTAVSPVIITERS